MSIPDSVYRFFDSLYDGGEYALFEPGRPYVSLRREAREFFGQDFTINNEQASEIWEEIEKFDYRKIQHKPTGDTYVGIPGGDFTTLIAMFIEL